MKPFDLQAALNGAKVVTRDGREVKIAGYNEDCDSLLGWVGNCICQWRGDGSGHYTHNAIFMAPTEQKEWVVRKPLTNGGIYIEGPYETKEGAEIAAGAYGTIHEITVID